MRKAFTLIELLIVMAVIAVLIGIAIPSFRGMQEEAKRAKARGDLRVLKLGVEAFNAKYSVYPSSGDLSVLTTSETQVVPTLPKDPWTGENYNYNKSGNYYIIWTAAGTTGTATVHSNGTVEASSGTIGVTNGTEPNAWK